MAKVEQIKKADTARRSFAAIQQATQSLITADLVPAIQDIDNGKFDYYVWKDRKCWKETPVNTESDESQSDEHM